MSLAKVEKYVPNVWLFHPKNLYPLAGVADKVTTSVVLNVLIVSVTTDSNLEKESFETV